MFLPQAARWKAASYEEIASFEKHGVYNLILIIAVPAEQRMVGTQNEQSQNKIKQQLMDRFEMTDIGDVLKGLGMTVTRDLEKGAITTDQSYYAENIVE